MRYVYSSRIWLLTFRSKLVPDENTPRTQRRSRWTSQFQVMFEHKGFPTDEAMQEAMNVYMTDGRPRKWEFQVLGCVQYEPEHYIIVQGDPIEEKS